MTDPTNNLIRDVLTAMGATPPVKPASPILDLNDLERRRALLQELWEDADARLRMYGKDTSYRGCLIRLHLETVEEYAGHALNNARWALEEAQAEATARGEEW